jgi:hypothetical protein
MDREVAKDALTPLRDRYVVTVVEEPQASSQYCQLHVPLPI